MQVKNNTSDSQVINVNDPANVRAQEKAGRRSRKQQNRKSFFAGDLGIGQDRVTKRKQRAQKRALKIIGDAWNGDRKYDQSISEIQDKCDLLREDIAKNQDIVLEGEAKKEELRQQYGVAKDSQEQKDLELLQKKQELGIVASDSLSREERQKFADSLGVEMLTEDEDARLAELKGQPLTEYQQRCLNINASNRVYEQRIYDAEEEIKIRNAAVRDMRLERLKQIPPMLKAQQQADKVMEQASDDVIGMLTDEAKEHVDETYEEAREEAKEKAEEKAEQEEKIEDRREEAEKLQEQVDAAKQESHEAEEARREQEEKAREEAEFLDDMSDAGMNVGGNVSDAKVEIKQMLHKMKILEEDLKGALVDEEV